MEFTLLCNLGGPHNASVSLRLRLLHVWPAKSPGDIRIYNYCTIWVDETIEVECFAQGMLIQGVSPTSMATGIRRNLSVDKIYVIKTFALSNPPNQYRACSFDLALGLSPSASFQPCVLPAESFPLDAYEFVAFSQLSLHAGNHRYLTDVVGRLSSISGISHKITNNGPTVKQTVIVEDESGSKVSITLWDEFSAVLDHVALTQADSIEALILAFGGLLVNKLGDDYVLSSSAATRISVNPPVPKAYFLASRFAEKHEVVESLPVEFATAADATVDADRRTRTLSQLLALSRTNASVEEKYRCGGVIVDVESSTPWYYISCKLCSRAVSKRRDDTFWCPKDWQLDEEQTRVNYKLQLTLRDDSCEARFILMVGGGGGALTLVNVSATHLAQRFPHRPGQLPPQLHQLRGQYIKFDCRLPLPGPTGFSSGEFRVTQVVPLDDPTVVGDLLEFSSAPPLAAPMMRASSVEGGPLVHRGPRRERRRFPSYEARDFRNPIYTNVRNEDIDTESRVLGASQVSAMGVQLGSIRAVAPAAMSSVVHSYVPSVQSATLMIPRRSARIEESMSPEDVGRGSSMPAAKVLKPSPESSPGMTLGSTVVSASASPLISPLSKIKVEKLDAAEGAQAQHGGSSQAGVDMERDASMDSQKKTSAKRGLLKK
ncbi:unnamed protein product [Linum trigynum]|uniref:Uncharacterized protein n=1 Tax=Linum trigynum TaxID=586398 RepID=A0AAV2CY33_9ROSI